MVVGLWMGGGGSLDGGRRDADRWMGGAPDRSTRPANGFTPDRLLFGLNV